MTPRPAPDVPSRLRRGFSLLLVFVLGAALAAWAVRREDRRMRDELLEQARRMAETIPLDRLKVLQGNRSDETRPEYRRLKEQLMAAQQIDPDWEWVYLMGRRKNGVVFFQMDSEAYDAPDPSPPGQLYAEASPLLHEVFEKRIAATEGPTPDRWGVWVSAFVPLADPKTDRLVTVVGIDVEASTWRRQSLQAAGVPALATLALLAILAAGFRLVDKRKTNPDRFRQPLWRHLESALSVSAGVVLTLTAAWVARRIETTHAREAFGAVAQIRTERILDAFLSLRRSELEGLARFIEGSETVTSQEFRRYARHLVRVPEVVAWAWVPVVASNQTAEFERSVRDAGWQPPEYRIWETGADGQPVPAADRPVHYPIYQVESAEALSKYGITPGRDLAALPAVRNAIENAERDGLITATAALEPLPGATSRQSQILVFRPVRKTPRRGPAKGFAMASVDPQSFLRSFLGENPAENMQVVLDLLALSPGAPPRRIASIAPPGFSDRLPARLTDAWTTARPILAFGQAYAVVVRPTANFLAYHTFHLDWLVLLAGFFITAASSTLISFIAHRREDMERQVEDQSRALAESMHHYGLLAKQSRVITWEIDADGRYVDVGDMVEVILGYRPDEIVGKKFFYDLCPEELRENFKREGLKLFAAGQPVTDVVNAMRAKSGRIVWVSSSAIPVRDPQGNLTGYWGTDTDVTDRKLAEEAMARMARENRMAADRYAALVRASNTGAWEYDDATKRMWCSPEYFSLLGYDPREFDLPEDRRTVQTLWLDLIHPGDRDVARQYLASYLGNPRRPYEQRYRMRRQDGSWAWIWSRGQMLFGPDGQPTAKMVGTHIDVTVTMRAEEALRESEQKYRMLTESMKDVVWIVDVETLRFLYVSPSVEKLRGFSPEEVVAGTIADALVPGEIDKVRPLLELHADEFRQGKISSDTFFTLELEQPCKRGGSVVTEAVARFWLNGRTGKLELHGVTRDVTDRKRVEENYRTLFQNMIEGFALHEVVCDDRGHPVDYRFLAVNPAFEKMTGLKAADLVGKTLSEAMPAADRKWAEIYGNVALNGIPLFFDNYSAEAGRHFEVTVFRPADRQFACIFNDVTERKLAEYDLRESRRQYVALMANLPGMAYRCRNDRAWTMEFVSQGCLDLTGYAPEDLVGNRTVAFGDVICPAHREAVWDEWQRALREHRRFEREYEIATRGGETKWVWEQGEGVYDDQGRVVALEGFIADVTGRKRAEAERERLIRAIEQSGETILITDPAGLILYVNPAFTRITGYSREEAIGQKPNLFSSGAHDRDFYRRMWATLAAGQTWEGQLVNKRKDGTLYTEQAAISPVRDPAGRIVNFVAVKRDITQQLRADEEKDALQAQLAHAQKLESVGRLAGGVAHDFNNMLQAILGYVEMAIEQVPPDQPLHADLREIQKAALRSTALTKQLQAFARKQVASPKVVDLNEAVEGTFAMLRRLIGEDVQLVWKPGRDVGYVRVDPGQLEQVVANLCINARDAIGTSGHVTLETSLADVSAPPDAGVPGDLPAGPYAVLSVRDDGCGMKPDVLDHIFEPFFTTKPLGKGTGLGLSTVYGAVKQNGGGIQVDSQPGKGSTFRIYLPRHEPQADEPEPPAAATPPADVRPHETILLVEDEETILRTTRRILESLGYRVLATDSPQDALRLADAHSGHVDLLLTDVIMSGMNGPELVRHLRERHPAVKHLFMSGYTANLLTEQGVKPDNSDFVQKPFSRTILAQKVRDALAAAPSA